MAPKSKEHRRWREPKSSRNVWWGHTATRTSLKWNSAKNVDCKKDLCHEAKVWYRTIIGTHQGWSGNGVPALCTYMPDSSYSLST